MSIAVPESYVKKESVTDFVKFKPDDEPVLLVDITKDSGVLGMFEYSEGNYVYESSFSVDLEKAISVGIEGISFEFFKEDPISESAKQEGSFDKFEVKFSANQFLQPLAGTPANSSVKYSAGISSTEKKLIAIELKPQEIKKLESEIVKFGNLNPTILISKKQEITTFAPFKLVSENAEKNGIDPALQISYGKKLGKTPGDVLGFGEKSIQKQQSGDFAKLGSNLAQGISLSSIRKSFLERNKTNSNNLVIDSLVSLQEITSSEQLLKDTPVAIVQVESKKKDYVRHFHIRKDKIPPDSDFYLVVKALLVKSNSKQAQVSKDLVFKILHSKNCKNFLSNPEPPTVKIIECKAGSVSFSLEKTDPSLQTVKVVRITKNSVRMKSSIEEIFAGLSMIDDQIYKDSDVVNVYPNTVTYRFIAMNSDGSCGKFSSVVIPSFLKPWNSQKNPLLESTPISIRAVNQSKGIQIEVDVLNEEVYSFRLIRQDLDAIGEIGKTTKTIPLDPSFSNFVANSNVAMPQNSPGTFSFIDTDVIQARRYRYFVAYRLGSGDKASLCQETISDEDESIVRFEPSPNLAFIPSITPAKQSLSDDGLNKLTVTFDINVLQTNELYNTLKVALQKAGVDQQFLVDLQNDTQKLKTIALFLVERIDRTTGRRTSFGFFPPGTFSDSPVTRAERKIEELQPGKKYEYVCKLCISTANSFLAESKQGFKDSSGKIINVSAAKFQSALISKGLLPSNKVLREGISISENLLLGFTGVEILTEVTLPEFTASFDSVDVVETNTSNVIRWSISGNLKNLNYFIVYCVYNGNVEVLGSVSAAGESSNSFTFKDEVFYDEVGKKSYYLRMVSLDHDVSVTSKTVSIEKYSFE